VYHLTTIRPHVDPGERFTARDFGIYGRGYARALVAALASMELVVRKRRLWVLWRMRVAAAARRAAARLADAARVRQGEEVGPVRNDFVEYVAERGHQMEWNFVSTCALGVRIAMGDAQHAGVGTDTGAPGRRRMIDLRKQVPNIHRPGATVQPAAEPGFLRRSAFDRSAPDVALPAGNTCRRQAVVGMVSHAPKNTAKERARSPRAERT
jgi:hypothetical protein